MKMRIISSKNEIAEVKPNEEVVHLTFRPSNKDIFQILTKCPDLQAVHIPESYYNTVSKTVKLYLDMQNISLIKGDVWGHRKDINEYSEISENIYERIREYRKQGLSDDEIVSNMEDTGLSDDFIRFLVKQNT